MRHAGRKRRLHLHDRLASFTCAGRGLRQLLAREPHARLHLAASLAVAVAGIALRLAASDWRALVIATALVWTAEAFNTAIEALCDRVCGTFDPAIGLVKDVAAAAVLLAAFAAALIGLLTFLPSLLERAR